MTASKRYAQIVAATCTLMALPALGQETSSAPSTGPVAARETEPNREQCLTAHVQAQVRRKESALLEASELLRICSSRACPEVIQTDCIQWTTEIEQQMPSIVIEARLGQQPAANVRVFVDNKPAPVLDSGRAVPIDPGPHVVRVEVPSHEPKEVAIIVYEGQRYQSIRFDFGDSQESRHPSDARSSSPRSAGAPAQNAQRSRPVPALTWALGGVGLLGVGGFVLFGSWGQSKQNDLDRQCSPNCSADRVDSVRTKYRLADLSLAVGAAAVVGAGVVFLTRPTKEQVVAVGVTPTLGGGGLYLQWSHF